MRTEMYRWQRTTFDPDWNEPEPHLFRFKVIKETNKGVWIETPNQWDKKPLRWVSLTNVRRYAYETPEKAFESFKIRTKKCHQILLSHIKICESYMKIKKCPKY